MKRAPTFVEGGVLLARLDVQAGALRLAIDDLGRLVGRRPDAVPAYVALVTAHLAAQEPDRALRVARALVKVAPRDPRGPHLAGLAFLAQGKRAEAREQFERALTISPGFLDPLAQITSLSISARQPEVALKRLATQIALVPRSAPHQVLLGQTHLARKDDRAAESAFLKAVDLHPQLAAAYLQLGQLYARTGRHDEALARLTEALKGNPRDLGLVMAAGVVYELTGDLTRARQAYERALSIDPRFAPAANNLAWLYSEHGGDREKALVLAQTARDAAPDDPRISDTLGWILYRRGAHSRALALLQESAAKLPDNPQVQYHLGMAYAQVGDHASARKALSAAVGSPLDFHGKEEARKALAGL
jgi:tetratricopeptide (TPR) repeat protein